MKEYLIHLITHLNVKVMKSLLLVLSAVVFSLTVASATNYPAENITFLEDESMELIVDANTSELFITATYNNSQSRLEFTSVSDIKFIQIFSSDNELQYQLPVLSNKVKISKSLFPGSGDYKLGFMIEGEEAIQFTSVKIK